MKNRKLLPLLVILLFIMPPYAVSAMEQPDEDLQLAIALSLSQAEEEKGEKEATLTESERLKADRELALKLQAEESSQKSGPSQQKAVIIRNMDAQKDKKFVKGFMAKNFEKLVGGAGSGYTLEDEFKEIAKHKNKIVTVGGKQAGLISWGRTSGLIYMIYVAPQFRNRSYAEMLLDEARKDLKVRGVKQMIAEVFKSNPKAKKFFEKAGFNVIPHKLPQFWKLTKNI
jgi:GNAT superfamily N-acetyltransferase